MTLGDCLYQVGKLEEALGYYKEALVGLRRLERGDFDVSVANCLSAMACICSDLGRMEEGEVLHRKALQGYHMMLGDSHPLTLMALSNLNNLLGAQGMLGEGGGGGGGGWGKWGWMGKAMEEPPELEGSADTGGKSSGGKGGGGVGVGVK